MEPLIESVELTVVVPIHDEGSHLAASYGQIRQSLLKAAVLFETIMVDDGSRDDSWGVMKGLAARFPEVRLLRLSRNFGKESAMCAGLEHARGRAVLVIDADLQHPPEYIAPMLSLWRDEGFDIVEAVKVSRGKEGLLRRVATAFFSSLLSILSGHDFRGASEYKLLDQKVVAAWLSMPERNLFFRGMVAWLGFRKAQICIQVADRRKGESKFSVKKLASLARTAVLSQSFLPLRVITVLGLAAAAGCLGSGGFTLYRMLSGQAVTSLMVLVWFQLLIGSALMLGLGVLGEYMAQMYLEAQGRPRYVVKETWFSEQSQRQAHRSAEDGSAGTSPAPSETARFGRGGR